MYFFKRAAIKSISSPVIVYIIKDYLSITFIDYNPWCLGYCFSKWRGPLNSALMGRSKSPAKNSLHSSNASMLRNWSHLQVSLHFTYSTFMRIMSFLNPKKDRNIIPLIWRMHNLYSNVCTKHMSMGAK